MKVDVNEPSLRVDQKKGLKPKKNAVLDFDFLINEIICLNQ